MRAQKRYVVVILALWLSSCILWGESGEALPEEAVSPPMETITPEVELVTPTGVVAVLEDQPAPQADADSDLPTPAPDPLVFVFPDSGPAPVSAWRPPLYPIPWVPSPYDHFYFARPTAADEVNWPTENYRYGGSFFDNEVHTGIDISAPPGTEVLAAGDGKVVWAGWGLYRGVPGDTSDPYGKAVVIEHDFGYQGKQLFTVYGHLQQVLVPRGQHVSTGDLLGLTGETGRVTGPHLHMEIRLGARTFFSTLNPELWLVPPQGWGVLAARFYRSNGKEMQGELIEITSVYTGQIWYARTYTKGAINKDAYYQENFVVSDLPAGLYQVELSYIGKLYSQTIDIYPGRVSFLSFYGQDGFNLDPPVAPGEDFNPFEAEDEGPS
jgi:murein DD-endopeptidase MepM/ murein hydrolase activator NlpD